MALVFSLFAHLYLSNLLTTEQLKSTNVRSKDGEELINDDLEDFYMFNMASTKQADSDVFKGVINGERFRAMP